MERGHYLIWTTLLGFDHTLPDCGVGRYLEKIGRKPDGFCALILHTDFVHLHRGMEEEYELPPDMTGFRGDSRKLDYLASRKLTWTNRGLRRLVGELHRAGVRMYFSLMGVYQSDIFRREWLSDHPELRLRTADGLHDLNALKRFEDGAYYEDFFIEGLCRVLEDYGLDGVHLADLFCPLPAPLAACDYSSDMVRQFLDRSGVQLPEDLLAGLDSDGDGDVKARREWIWRHKREEWIRFYDWRWTSFYTKLCGALHGIGREVGTIGMYVSDPFQSYYHMGLDVRHLTEAGVDFFTANIVPTMATMNNPARPFLFHRYMTIAPAMKALSGNGTLYLMLGVRDDAEEWDSVHHAPNQLERDIYTAFAYRTVTKDGVLRCIEKPFVTLGEGLEAEDWKTVNRYLDIAYSLDTEKVVSPVLYWSDRAHDSMLREYIRTRRRSVCKILAELQARGAFCGGVVRGDALSACSGPLLVPNFDLLPEDEVRDLVRYEGPVMGIVPADYDLTPLGVPAAEFRDRFSEYPMKAFLLHADPVTDFAPYEELLRTDDGAPDLTEDSLDLDDDRDVMDYEMWFCKMTGGFLDACAMLFRHMDGLGNPFSCNTPLLVFQTGEDLFRLYLYNRYEDRYDHALVRSERRVSSADVVSTFPYLKVKFLDEALSAYDDPAEAARRSDRASMRCFQVKLRPGGAGIVDVRLQSPQDCTNCEKR